MANSIRFRKNIVADVLLITFINIRLHLDRLWLKGTQISLSQILFKGLPSSIWLKKTHKEVLTSGQQPGNRLISPERRIIDTPLHAIAPANGIAIYITYRWLTYWRYQSVYLDKYRRCWETICTYWWLNAKLLSDFRWSKQFIKPVLYTFLEIRSWGLVEEYVNTSQ